MMTPKRIGLVGFNGVTALHLVGPGDAFSSAALDDGYGGRISCYEVWTLSVGDELFRAESGLAFTAQATLGTAPDLDSIIVAGGSGIRQSGVGEEIAAWLLQRASRTRRIGAVCAGIYGLAPTGLLDGREVTTHWRIAGDVARRFPRLKVGHKRPLVQDGPYYTSTGLSAGLSLSLAFIEEDYGPHLAQSVGRELVSLQTESSFPSSPAHFESQPINRFADLVAWIMRNLDADLSVEILARRACMCQDHFSKAFKSVLGEPPSIFVENLRLNEAQRRLSKKQRTLNSIAASVGFTNPAVFQKAFERRFGTRPIQCLEAARLKPVPKAGKRRYDDPAGVRLALAPAA